MRWASLGLGIVAVGALGGQALALGTSLCTVMSKHLGDMIPVPGEHSSLRSFRGRPQQVLGQASFQLPVSPWTSVLRRLC